MTRSESGLKVPTVLQRAQLTVTGVADPGHSVWIRRALLLLLCVGMFAVTVHGQAPIPAAGPAGVTINLKEGKPVVTTRLRRIDGKVMATQQIGAGTGEIGYPAAAIARIDFPEPPQIKTAADLLAQGKADTALAQIDPIVSYYAPFKDLPGNWWPQSVRIRLNALVALKRDADASALVDEIVKSSNDPEAASSARVLMAGSLVRKGDPEKAAAVCDEVLKASNDPDTLALAWVTKGRANLALKDCDSALLAFLRVPVFYPDQTSLMPQALLGSGRAYAGLADKENAEKTFNELISRFPSSAEAADAKNDLQKLKK